MITKPLAQGFTLIEMLVTISIAILLVGGGITNYITFNDRQNLQNSARLLQTYFRSAQTKARAGDMPSSCDRLNGYRVQLTAGTGVVVLSAICANGNYTYDTYTLPGGVSSENSHSITFANLYGGVSGAGQISLVTSTLTTYEYIFDVTAGGEVTVGAFTE